MCGEQGPSPSPLSNSQGHFRSAQSEHYFTHTHGHCKVSLTPFNVKWMKCDKWWSMDGCGVREKSAHCWMPGVRKWFRHSCCVSTTCDEVLYGKLKSSCGRWDMIVVQAVSRCQTDTEQVAQRCGGPAKGEQGWARAKLKANQSTTNKNKYKFACQCHFLHVDHYNIPHIYFPMTMQSVFNPKV